MKIWDPTYPENKLSPDMDPELIGRTPFLLRHGSFRVIDGDTIHALSGRRKAFSMRMRSVNAPEAPVKRGTDKILSKSSIDPYWDSLGNESTELLRAYVDGRAILIHPTGGLDHHGRMLCDMYVVPYTNREPDVSRSVSLEHLLLHQKKADPFRDEQLPEFHPQQHDDEITFFGN